MKNTNPFNHVGLLYHLPKTGEGVLVKDKGILNIFLDILQGILYNLRHGNI